MTRPRRLLAVLATAALLAPPPATGVPAGKDCDEYVPAAYTLPTDPPKKVTLTTLVLHDGLSRAEAAKTAAEVARLYAPLGITVRPAYRAVKLTGDAPMPDGTPAGRAEKLFPQFKKAVGGRRPVGTDLVFLLTSKRLFLWQGDTDGDGKPDEGERTYGVAGVAECIGGVRWADKSFGLSVGPAGKPTWTVKDAALTMAHEMGHLLGAHHHYSDCVQGTADGPRDGVVRACTIMFNATYGRGPVHTIADRWSPLEASVIRGHAAAYAAP